MKNPFLEGRSLLSNVQKPISKTNKNQYEGEYLMDKKKQYPTKNGFKIDNASNSNAYSSNIKPFSYQKQSINFNNAEIVGAAQKHEASQKIAFNNHLNGEAQVDRQTGYFNIPDVLTVSNANKDAGKSYEYTAYNAKLGFEFAPPPINNFASNPIEERQQFQLGYGKSNKTHSDWQKQSYKKNSFGKDSFQMQGRLMQSNPYNQPSNSYKSSPKEIFAQKSPKNDISRKFKQNSYDLSPIGEVSKHRINDDSLMQLDGLIDGIEFDKLLADSKNQEQLFKMLGMDTNILKKNDLGAFKSKSQQHQYQKFQPPLTNKNFPHQNQSIKSYQLYQPPNQFADLQYGPSKVQEEPQVFNYGAKHQQANHQTLDPQDYQTTNFLQKIKMDASKLQTLKLENSSGKFYIQQAGLRKQQLRKSDNSGENVCIDIEESDLQKLMQQQMQKLMFRQENAVPNQRIFMTTHEKIVTKRYKLMPL